MKNCWLTLIALLFLFTSLGCGNSERERGKNSQLDRPKSTAAVP